jgi:hypothetical protein
VYPTGQLYLKSYLKIIHFYKKGLLLKLGTHNEGCFGKWATADQPKIAWFQFFDCILLKIKI